MKTSKRLRKAFALVILLGAGVFIAAWVVIWLMRGSYLTAVIALGAAILCLNMAFQLAYALSGARQPRTESGPEGTKIRPRQFADLTFCLGLAAGVSAAALYLTFSSFGMVDYVPSGFLQLALPAGCLFYVIFGATILYGVVRHRGASHLRLDPHGVEVWDGQWSNQWNPFARLSWDEVEQVLDHRLREKRPFHDVIAFVLSEGRSAVLVTDTITGNSRALTEWVQFYWQHPEYRGELVDDRALQRLHEEKFTAE